MGNVRVPYIVYSECLACGSCEEICPEVFKLDEKEGYALVINQGGANPDKIQEAMDSCPTECIHWEEL
jgi:ferredoxin